MSLTKHRRYLGACLLLVTFWCGACTMKQTSIKTPTVSQDDQVQNKRQDQEAATPYLGLQHGFDKTEVDLESGQLEPASRYHPPRGTQLYTFDGTESDLSNDIKRINRSQPH